MYFFDSTRIDVNTPFDDIINTECEQKVRFGTMATVSWNKRVLKYDISLSKTNTIWTVGQNWKNTAKIHNLWVENRLVKFFKYI